MSITTLPTRICLVGAVGQDADTLQAAESFGLPIVTSETGLDIIGESDWRTFYVLDDFEGASFEAIHKQKEWWVLVTRTNNKPGGTRRARSLLNLDKTGGHQSVTCGQLSAPSPFFFCQPTFCPVKSHYHRHHYHAEPQQNEFEIETHARVYCLLSNFPLKIPPIPRLTASAMRQIYQSSSFRFYTLSIMNKHFINTGCFPATHFSICLCL